MNALCQRPGCSGKIVDGVCEDCGRAPLGQSLVKPANLTTANSKTVGGGAAIVATAKVTANDNICQRSGCSGKIVDGVCEDCGRAPKGSSLVNPAGAALASNRAANRASSSLSSSSSSSSSSASRGTRGSGRASSRSSRRSSRRALGAGLVNLTPLPSQDPLQLIIANPAVPENKRYCNACDAKVNHEKGYCPQCGKEYNFIPSLAAGDLVANQYEVKGAIAFGGLGWIYLAWDNLLSRWAVLKGLLNSKDEASAAAALAERQFLAAVKHAKIVGVYNFVNRGNEGFIVMEYVGGKSLKQLRLEHGGPLPITEAIAYIHGILPAFAYLERNGLVYCDFKPDNCMLEGEDVKLIDMGGVRRIDDLDADIYGTKGYSAPEASESPSFVSDLYTVARTLAVLCLDFKFQSKYEHSLPTPEEAPLFAEHESFYRFLLKATREDPDERFQSGDEMSEQLLGVLREIVATVDNPSHVESAIFGDDMMINAEADGEGIISVSYRLLPALKVDANDSAAQMIVSASPLNQSARKAQVERAMRQFPDSAEAVLRLANLLIDAGDYNQAEKLLADLATKDRFDWRVGWYRGRAFIAQGKAQDAVKLFDQVYSELPGELPPKLAIALAAEMAGDLNRAVKFYQLVARVDAGYLTSLFGLARCLNARGDRNGAVAAYARVPASSSLFPDAQIAMIKTLLQSKAGRPTVDELSKASESLTAISMDNYITNLLAAQLMNEAIGQLSEKKIQPDQKIKLLGQPLLENSLRTGAERAYRACARYAQTTAERYRLIDQANNIRPFSLF